MGWFKGWNPFCKATGKSGPPAFDSLEDPEKAVEKTTEAVAGVLQVEISLPEDPEPAPTRKELNLLTVRKNGFTCPPSLWQVLSPILVFYFLVTSQGLLHCVPGYQALLVMHVFLLVVVIGSALYTMSRDPGIPNTKRLFLVPGDRAHIEDGYCHTCDTKVQRRVKHCRFCNKCVFRFDHHCYVVNNCIGASNHSGFVTMLVTAVTYLVSLSLMSCVAIILHHYMDFDTKFGTFHLDTKVWIGWNIVNLVAALAPMVEFGPYIYWQINAKRHGMTQYEYFNYHSEKRREKERMKELESVVVEKSEPLP